MLYVSGTKFVADKQTVVFSDSLSALQKPQTYQTSRPDLLNTIPTLLHKSTQSNQHIQFQWIPSHFGIQGNENVDNTAKQALTHNNLNNKAKASLM
jgi:ribonuclease HI